MRIAAGATLVVFVAGCGSSPPAEGAGSAPRFGSPGSAAATPPSDAISSIRVHEGVVAVALDDMTAAKPGPAPPELARTVFVMLREPATLSSDAKMRTYIVARDAAFDVADDGRASGPQPFTAIWPSGAACVGHAEQKLTIRTNRESSAPPDIARGLVLEGCEPPPDAYALHVVTGAHPGARRRSASHVAPSAAPAWTTTPAPPRDAPNIVRFDGADPIFVVTRERAGATPTYAWRVGGSSAAFGEIEVDVPGNDPVVLEVAGRTLVVGGNEIVEVRAGALQPVGRP